MLTGQQIRPSPIRARPTPYAITILAFAAGSAVQIACSRSDSTSERAAATVVVYCSVDETYARPILDRFEERTGIRVEAMFDSEAGKTTGLLNRLIAENRSGRPGADVFWSGELFGTMRLAESGILEAYEPATPMAEIPARFRDPAGRWNAMAARARVLAFNPDKTPRDQVPKRWEDLARPNVAPNVAIANPLFGTTRGHVAAMFALWGPDRAQAFLRGLRDNEAIILDGNSATVRAVINGRARFAATDSDDVYAAQRAGATIDFVEPDLGDGGTLLIPCSVGLVKKGPSSASAKSLVDYLVSGEVERLLAESESRNIPVRETLRKELNVSWPAETLIEFQKIMEALEASDTHAREILIRP